MGKTLLCMMAQVDSVAQAAGNEVGIGIGDVMIMFLWFLFIIVAFAIINGLGFLFASAWENRQTDVKKSCWCLLGAIALIFLAAIAGPLLLDTSYWIMVAGLFGIGIVAGIAVLGGYTFIPF